MKMVITAVLTLLLCGIFPIAPIAAVNAPPINPALELIHALGCKGCHTIDGDGGSLATDLSRAGNRLTAGQIEAQLTTDAAIQAKGFMPNYGSLPKNDLQRISEYLDNLR